MHRKKMISNSSLQKFNFQGPPCLNNYYLPKMHNGLDTFAMEEKKKYSKWNRISRVCYWNSKIEDIFSKTFIKATSSGEKVKS